MQARVRPPESMENPRLRNLQKNAFPKTPNTMEGTPARTSRLSRITRAIRKLAGTHSARRTAVPREMGSETAIQIPTIIVVDTRIGAIPPSRPERLGASIRNDHDR